MSKFMIIEVEAKLILTVPSAKDGEDAADVVLDVEQFINKLHPFNRPKTGTLIGVRIHAKDYKTLVDSVESQEESLKQPSPLKTVEDFTTGNTVVEQK